MTSPELRNQKKARLVLAVVALAVIIGFCVTAYLQAEKVQKAESDGISRSCQQCLTQYYPGVKVEEARSLFNYLSTLPIRDAESVYTRMSVKENCWCNCTRAFACEVAE